MGAHEYLEKYTRSLPGGALAWERTIFSRTWQWDAGELIDAAVDIAWDAFMAEFALERPGLDISYSGNYLVIRPLTVVGDDFLSLAA